MKRNLINTIALIALVTLLAAGCKKEDEATVPTLTTTEVTAVTQNTAVSGGTITDDGGADITREGVCWGTTPTPTVGDSLTQSAVADLTYTSNLSHLTASTTYYLRAYATNSAGTGYGNALTFTTLPAVLPVLMITNPARVTRTTVGFDCQIQSDGGEPPMQAGVCWGLSENPTLSDSKTVETVSEGKFSSTITGLTPNTTYYARVYATNTAGTTYGNSMLVRTMYGTVTDIDGNVYQTVLIGTQEWMAENLKVTHYRSGEPIPNVTDETQWDNMSSGAYCNYNNNAAYVTTYGSYVTAYGRLYNWFAVSDSRSIAPTGWHVASDYDWNILVSFLGGTSVAGIKLKEVDNIYSPSDNADNSSGFTARYGGLHDSQTMFSFNSLGSSGYWWTSTSVVSTPTLAYTRVLISSYSDMRGSGTNKKYGMSVRCVKD